MKTVFSVENVVLWPFSFSRWKQGLATRPQKRTSVLVHGLEMCGPLALKWEAVNLWSLASAAVKVDVFRRRQYKLSPTT